MRFAIVQPLFMGSGPESRSAVAGFPDAGAHGIQINGLNKRPVRVNGDGQNNIKINPDFRGMVRLERAGCQTKGELCLVSA